MRVCSLLLLSWSLAGCYSLGAFESPHVLGARKVRIGAEYASMPRPPPVVPEALRAPLALRLDVGVGGGVEVSVLGGGGYGGVVKAQLPVPGRWKAAIFTGASRSVRQEGYFGGYARYEATTAFAGITAGPKGALFPKAPDLDPVLWPYIGARLLYAAGLDDEPYLCDDCSGSEVRHFRGVMPAVSLGLSLSETIGPKAEVSVVFGPRVFLMYGGSLRF